LRLFSFGGYGLVLAALALVVFGAFESPPPETPPGGEDVYFNGTLREGEGLRYVTMIQAVSTS